MIGSSDLPGSSTPPPDIPPLERGCRFPPDQFPGGHIGPGDRLVYYAVGGFKSIFAIVDVAADPRRDVPYPDPVVRSRWPHAVDVTMTPWRVDDLAHAPALVAVSRLLAEAI